MFRQTDKNDIHKILGISMSLSLDSSILASSQVVEIKKIEQQLSDVQNEVSGIQTNDFLSITSRQPDISGNSWILQAMGYDDVITGTVEDEIQSVISETEAIASAMDNVKPQTNYSRVPTTTVRNYGSSETFECSTNTSSAAIAAAVERGDYNKTYGSGKTAQQYKDAVVKAFEGVITYLDDLIANYDTKVASGLASGHQEVKLTTLLQLRNAMKNCDVVINIEDTYGKSVDYGAYYAYSTAEYVVTMTDGTKRGAVVGTSTDYDVYVSGMYLKFVNEDLDRHYNRQMCFTTDSLDSYINSGFAHKYMLATVMHEFSHSLHIPNECIAYLMGEVIADDLNYPLNWGMDWANAGYGYGGTLDSDDEVLYFGDWWEHTSQGSVDKNANASEFANYTADPNYDKNAAINKRFVA